MSHEAPANLADIGKKAVSRPWTFPSALCSRSSRDLLATAAERSADRKGDIA